MPNRRAPYTKEFIITFIGVIAFTIKFLEEISKYRIFVWQAIIDRYCQIINKEYQTNIFTKKTIPNELKHNRGFFFRTINM